MTLRVPSRVDTLKKWMGIFPIDYEASESTYTPARPLGGGTTPSEQVPLGSPPSPFNLLAALGGSNASITTGISESRVVATSALFCLLLYLIISYARSPMRKLPPQPPRAPIVGNLSQMTDKKWLFSRELKEQYSKYMEFVGRILNGNTAARLGEVMYLDVLGKPTIIFNSLKSAFDVLERRARNSPGRPRYIMANEVLNQGLGLVLTDYSDL
jgi:hypothetical protein